jgi:hypothetical protein
MHAAVARRGLSLLGAGGLLGLVTPLLERLSGHSTLTLAGLAGYAVLGGLCAALAGLVARRDEVRPLLLPALVQALLLLFWVNVFLLPDVGLLHWRSILWSLAVLLPLGLALLGVGGLARRFPRALAALGGAGVVGCLLVLRPLWPVEPAQRPPRGDGPNIVVVVMDAVRRDHVGLHGSRLGATPDLDRLFGGGRIYDSAYSGSGWTRVSVPIILGSRQHSQNRPGMPTLLHPRGYASACFSDNPILERGSSVSRDFRFVGTSVSPALRFGQQVFEGSFVGQKALRWSVLAHLWDDDILVDDALAWARQTGGPFFLYVHLMDAHQPYDEGAIDGRPLLARKLMTPQPGQRFTAGEEADIRAHYAGGVRSAQAAGARLVSGVAALGRPYLAIVTADHGESLGEGQRWGHTGITREVVSVPLALLGAGVVPGRVTLPVGQTSLLRTVLAAAGVTCEECSGTDLRSSEGEAEVVGEYPPDQFYRVRDGHRLIVSGQQVSLYDLAADPLESRDVSAASADLVQALRLGLVPSAQDRFADSSDTERFRALGYVQ